MQKELRHTHDVSRSGRKYSCAILSTGHLQKKDSIVLPLFAVVLNAFALITNTLGRSWARIGAPELLPTLTSRFSELRSSLVFDITDRVQSPLEVFHRGPNSMR